MIMLKKKLYLLQVKDIVKIHSEVCPSLPDDSIQTSIDGVAEAKSNSVSLDVYSSKFNRCRYIYPHRIVRPLRKEFVDNREQLRKVIYDWKENNIRIDVAVADQPKRAFLKYCLNFASLFPCEYCFARETKFMCKKQVSENSVNTSKTMIKDKIKRIRESKNPKKSAGTLKVLQKLLLDLEQEISKKARQITVWPPSTANKELRTKEKILEIVTKIEENEADEESDPLSKEEKKGVVGRSELLDLDYFDFVNHVPPEYMHLVCLGVVKRLTELTFNVGTNRPRVTNRKLSSTKMFNILMSKTKVLLEFSRRSRNLDFAVYKAEEFRNLILFFFPYVLECLEKNAKERSVWLYLAFMIRSCVLPDSEYFNVDVNQIVLSCEKFYKLYEKLFGPNNCTYNTHVLSSHLPQLRELGPLTKTSAFKFESFYGEIRNSFTPGTPSPLKQVFENILLKRALAPHSCEKSTTITNYDTALTSNSLVYTYVNDKVTMYKVLDIDTANEVATCHEQGKFTCEFKETPELSWSSVGVFQKGAICKDIINVPQSEIAGKVIKVGSLLITCPDNVLKEK